MRIILLSLILATATFAYATENVEVVIFSKLLHLEGNCKYSPSAANISLLICHKNGKSYTASIRKLEADMEVLNQLLIDPEIAKKWKIKILATNSEQIDGLLHARSIAITEDGAIRSDQYHICDVYICITLTADTITEYESIVHQLSSRIIEANEIETDL